MDLIMFDNAKEFSQFIELTAIQSERTVLEVIVDYMNNNQIDAEDIKHLITVPLKNKLYLCGIEKNLIKKESNQTLF